MRANLSINADVTYVKEEQYSKHESLFTLYDVYNPGSHLGGQLNITIDQSIKCNRTKCELNQYLSDLYKRTRLQQRMDLSGVTFRQVAVVSSIWRATQAMFLNPLICCRWPLSHWAWARRSCSSFWIAKRTCIWIGPHVWAIAIICTYRSCWDSSKFHHMSGKLEYLLSISQSPTA